MKSLKFLAIAFTFFAILATACQSGNDEARDQAVETAKTQSPPPPAAPATSATTVNSSVKHYICPNNCAGSGGDGAGTCPVCGTAYQHNSAYHNNTAATPPTPTATTPNPATPTPPATPEPAQNAAGVWHYTCSAGCAGGAGAAGTCATCGGPLAHNAAYHN